MKGPNMEIQHRDYEPSRHINSFHVRGFQHWDGAFVLADMKPGSKLTLHPEPDNPHDSQAVALYFNGTKIGYLPQEENELIATMFYYGHGNAFEAHVLQVDPEASPWNQVFVAISIADAR